MRFTINYTTRALQISSTGVKPVCVQVTIKAAGSCYGASLIERTKMLAEKNGLAMLHRGDTLKGVFRKERDDEPTLNDEPTMPIHTNTKRNEHPACGCRWCRRGAGRGFGQYIHTHINRAIRHATKVALKKLNPEDFEPILVSTPYTD